MAASCRGRRFPRGIQGRAARSSVLHGGAVPGGHAKRGTGRHRRARIGEEMELGRHGALPGGRGGRGFLRACAALVERSESVFVAAPFRMVRVTPCKSAMDRPAACQLAVQHGRNSWMCVCGGGAQQRGPPPAGCAPAALMRGAPVPFLFEQMMELDWPREVLRLASCREAKAPDGSLAFRWEGVQVENVAARVGAVRGVVGPAAHCLEGGHVRRPCEVGSPGRCGRSPACRTVCASGTGVAAPVPAPARPAVCRSACAKAACALGPADSALAPMQGAAHPHGRALGRGGYGGAAPAPDHQAPCVHGAGLPGDEPDILCGATPAPGRAHFAVHPLPLAGHAAVAGHLRAAAPGTRAPDTSRCVRRICCWSVGVQHTLHPTSPLSRLARRWRASCQRPPTAARCC